MYTAPAAESRAHDPLPKRAQPPSTTGEVSVNPHYLDRVVAFSEASDVEASEDIVAGNGMKLLAKGAKIDARVRDRLLAHKLSKPLETMMRVVEGVAARRIDRVAEGLLHRHALLARICGAASGRLLIASLRDLILTPQLDSLLSLYAAQGSSKLEHAVGVALLGASMAGEIPAGGPSVDVMLLAALAHDIGELYIDPAILSAGQQLTQEQWRHIAAHPIVGSRVLAEMPGAGPKVALAVLHHHERLDGFGYPRGLRGDTLPLAGQVLAMAELLMGLMESGGHEGERAAVAVKLIPGEFSRMLVDKVAAASRQPAEVAGDARDAGSAGSPQQLAERVAAVYAALQRFRECREAIVDQFGSSSPAARALLQHAIERCERISVAFSSTGLDAQRPEAIVARLAEFDVQVQLEVTIVLREIQWRLRELRREAVSRAAQFPPHDAALVRQFVDATRT
jgi:hypothetical protein